MYYQIIHLAFANLFIIINDIIYICQLKFYSWLTNSDIDNLLVNVYIIY